VPQRGNRAVVERFAEQNLVADASDRRGRQIFPQGGAAATGALWEPRLMGQAPLWRAIAVYRIAALAYVTILVVRNVGHYREPILAWPVLAVMAGWTVVTTYAYANPDRRRPPLLLADLLITMGAMASSVWIVGRPALEQGRPTLAVAWHVAPVLAWAVAYGRRGGVAAAVSLGATDLIVRGHYDQAAYTGSVLMLLAAFAVGYLVRLADASQERLQRAIEIEAATRERERLARDIHDSVLQVLAMVKRRGVGLDGEAAELARLAGEQEAALRNLVGSHPIRIEQTGEADLMALLGPRASGEVSVAGPADPVRVPDRVARELTAAVAAALDNVVQHCPLGTKAYVLVEQEPGAVTVSVRDEGDGITPTRLAHAASQGRLGVAQSIRGRIADLGGRVQITSAPGQGTEIEMVVPIS
jgi:signal transduction histidine kinase